MAATPTDWEAIEREYRAGQLSVSEIGRLHRVSHTAINKKAKACGWERDLTAKVRKRIATKLVTPEEQAKSENEAVELAAARGVQVIRDHMKSIGRARSVCDRLIEELGARDVEPEDAEAAAKMSLKDAAGTMKALAGSLKDLVGLERQAFGLDDQSAPAAVTVQNQNVSMSADEFRQLARSVAEEV